MLDTSYRYDNDHEGMMMMIINIVAFPNRKSYFLDNKLEFLGIKLAEYYGFRYSPLRTGPYQRWDVRKFVR